MRLELDRLVFKCKEPYVQSLAAEKEIFSVARRVLDEFISNGCNITVEFTCNDLNMELTSEKYIQAEHDEEKVVVNLVSEFLDKLEKTGHKTRRAYLKELDLNKISRYLLIKHKEVSEKVFNLKTYNSKDTLAWESEGLDFWEGYLEALTTMYNMATNGTLTLFGVTEVIEYNKDNIDKIKELSKTKHYKTLSQDMVDANNKLLSNLQGNTRANQEILGKVTHLEWYI